MSAQKFGYMAVFTAAISLGMAGNAMAFVLAIPAPGATAPTVVRRSSTGDFSVSFADFDLTAGTVKTLTQTPSIGTRSNPAGPDPGDNFIRHYRVLRLVDGGITDIGDNSALAGLTFQALSGASNVFTGPNFARAEFYASESPVQVNAPGVLPFSAGPCRAGSDPAAQTALNTRFHECEKGPVTGALFI